MRIGVLRNSWSHNEERGADHVRRPDELMSWEKVFLFGQIFTDFNYPSLCHKKKYFSLDNFSPISMIQVSFGAHLEGEVLGLVFSFHMDFKWQQCSNTNWQAECCVSYFSVLQTCLCFEATLQWIASALSHVFIWFIWSYFNSLYRHHHHPTFLPQFSDFWGSLHTAYSYLSPELHWKKNILSNQCSDALRLWLEKSHYSDNFVFTVKIYQVDNVLKLLFSTGPDKARNDLTIRQSRLLKF